MRLREAADQVRDLALGATLTDEHLVHAELLIAAALRETPTEPVAWAVVRASDYTAYGTEVLPSREGAERVARAINAAFPDDKYVALPLYAAPSRSPAREGA